MRPPLIRPANGSTRPEVALDAHDVLVAGQQERLLGRVLGAQARDEVGLARRRRRHDLDLEAERREPRLQQLGDLRLVAGRVGRVDPDQLLQQRDDLAVGPVVLRLRHAREERASDQERHQYTRQPPRTHAPASQRGRRGAAPTRPGGAETAAHHPSGFAQASSTASRGRSTDACQPGCSDADRAPHGALAAACPDRDRLRRRPAGARRVGDRPAGRGGAARALGPARDAAVRARGERWAGRSGSACPARATSSSPT